MAATLNLPVFVAVWGENLTITLCLTERCCVQFFRSSKDRYNSCAFCTIAVPKFANMLGIDHVSSIADFQAPASSTMDVAGAESNLDMSNLF